MQIIRLETMDPVTGPTFEERSTVLPLGLNQAKPAWIRWRLQGRVAARRIYGHRVDGKEVVGCKLLQEGVLSGLGAAADRSIQTPISGSQVQQRS